MKCPVSSFDDVLLIEPKSSGEHVLSEGSDPNPDTEDPRCREVRDRLLCLLDIRRVPALGISYSSTFSLQTVRSESSMTDLCSFLKLTLLALFFARFLVFLASSFSSFFVEAVRSLSDKLSSDD